MAFFPPVPVSLPGFAPQARSLLGALSRRRGLVVVHGHPQGSRLAHYFLAGPLLRGEAVLFLDAANCFDPHRLAAFAHRCRRSPEEFLERVHLSRAFTCFQLAELIARTPAAARRYRVQRVLLTGVPDIFDDEELPAAEVRQVFRRSLEQLKRWPPAVLTALVFSDASARPHPLRHWLDRQLQRQATAVYRLEEGAAGLCLRAEKDLQSPGLIPGEGTHGSHHRHLSPVDRGDPRALRALPARPAPGRPAGV